MSGSASSALVANVGEVVPSISISGAVSVNGTMTVTAAGRPTPTLTLMRNGSSAGVITSPYAYVGGDVGPTLTVVASNLSGSRTSNSLVYDPVADASILEGIDPSVIPGTTFSSFVGLKGRTISVNTGTGTKDATGLNGTPCLTFGGSTSLKLSINLSAQSAVYIVAPLIQPQATLAWLFSLATGFDQILNDSGPWEMVVNPTNWQFVTAGNLGSTSSPCILTTKYDRTVNFGSSGVRKNGVSLTISQHGTGAVPSPTTMPNGIFYIGNRVDLPVSSWTGGKLGVMLICAGGMTANQLATVEAYANYRSGGIF